MKILISGASGLVGTALAQALRARGHEPVPLVRPPAPAPPGQVRWNPETGELDLAAAAGAGAVVNLAGASIAAGRWTEARKRLLWSSRVDATQSLIAALSRLSPPPAVFISASAVGYYGDRGDELLTEASAPGKDFLAQLAQNWEAAAQQAAQHGMRTVILRFGMVLAPHGGALARMLPPFRFGLGGPLGSGRQWVSWIALEDAVGIITQALEHAEWGGVYNAVAPEPVRNRDFARALGHVLGRPAALPVPAVALRLLFGELADALLLASQRVIPQRLQAVGYQYAYNDLTMALAAMLKR